MGNTYSDMTTAAVDYLRPFRPYFEEIPQPSQPAVTAPATEEIVPVPKTDQEQRNKHICSFLAYISNTMYNYNPYLKSYVETGVIPSFKFVSYTRNPSQTSTNVLRWKIIDNQKSIMIFEFDNENVPWLFKNVFFNFDQFFADDSYERLINSIDEDEYFERGMTPEAIARKEFFTKLPNRKYQILFKMFIECKLRTIHPQA